MIEYKPSFIDKLPPTINDIPSAWIGLEKIIRPILKDFKINSKSGLEIGVDYGYSLYHLSEIFDEMIGVDTFEGDIHAGKRSNQYEIVLNTFKKKNNVKLIQSSYENFLNENKQIFDLVHIDIVHTYEETFKCATMCSKITNCIILHDTESFPEIKMVCKDISNQENFTFYNYPHNFGLGILIK